MRKVGDYTIEGQLGAGGMGVVLRARAPDGRAVAIKIVQRPSDADVARFDRERRLLATFGLAEGFVPLIDAGAIAQGPYLVMPLLDGGTLRDRLKDAKALPVREALELGRAIVAAVARAHSRGVVHRDLKPENVLFAHRGADSSPSGRPLVADLGLAKHFRRDDLGGSKSLTLTGANEFKGTICYMAPEQMVDARAVGPQADVFSLGAILYELLTGQTPFGGEDVLDLIKAVQTGAHLSARRVRPDVPAWLDAAIEKALRADPAERFSDAHELALALRGPERASRVIPFVASGAVVLVAGGLLVALTGTRKPSSPPPPPPPPTLPVPPPAIGSATATAAPTVDALLATMRTCYDRKDWQGVIDAATKAVDLDRGFMRGWAFRAEAYRSLGRNKEAVADYDVVVAASPDAVTAYLGRGRCHYNLEEWKAAIDDLDRAMALGTTEDLLVYDLRSVALLRVGRRQEAIADFTALLAREPRRDDCLANRGIAKREVGDARGALADYDAAIAINPKVAVYHANRAMALYELKDFAAARDAFETSISLDDRSEFTWTNYGRLLSEMKDDDAALAAYDRGIAARPDRPYCYVNRANIRQGRGDHEGAIADATKALAIDDKIAAAWTVRGNARNDLGDTAGAIADHTKAIELGLSLGYKNRGVARKVLGDNRGAAADLEKFFELNPNRPADDPARSLLRVIKAQLAGEESRRRGDGPSDSPR